MEGILPQYISDKNKTTKIEIGKSSPTMRKENSSGLSRLFRKRA